MDGTPGAVSITHGDTKRLADDEFLNDTLIEYGMKRIYFGLQQPGTEKTNPPHCASDVHMFNSFFYKRLTQRKTMHDKNGV